MTIKSSALPPVLTRRGVRCLVLARGIAFGVFSVSILMLGGLGFSSDYASITPGSVALVVALVFTSVISTAWFDTILQRYSPH